MQGRSLVPEPAAFIPEESLNKYLLDIVDSSLIADVYPLRARKNSVNLIVIRYVSPPRRSTPVRRIYLKKTAAFIYRCDNPAWSKYIHVGDKWLKLSKINGVITSVERISCNADETLYEAVLEHPLALLNTRLRSAVYQNVSVPELVRQIFQEQSFEGYEINFDRLTWNYPVREMLVQWKETDLAFIRRLLAKVGIWFRFEPHPDDDNIVVIVFSDSQAAYLFNHKIALLNPAGTTCSACSIYQLKAKHAVVPASVAVRNYNYRASRDVNGLDEGADLSRGSACTEGGEYHYGDNHLSAGVLWAIHNGQDAETSWHYARIRHELLLNSQTVLSAITDNPAIVPGVEVTVKRLIPKTFETGMVITKIHSSGSRSSFQSKLTGIPYSETVSFRPQRLSRPVISGTLPARISGEQRNDRLARLDRAGRYRVRFDFDQAEWKKGLESMPVRLGRQYAGNAFGFHFSLLDNTEVGIAFENGDPERPFIAHAFHDELNPDVVTNLNSSRNVIRTQRNNKLRMEDKEGEEHIKLATEYGKTQLNLGHLVDSAGAAKGSSCVPTNRRRSVQRKVFILQRKCSSKPAVSKTIWPQLSLSLNPPCSSPARLPPARKSPTRRQLNSRRSPRSVSRWRSRKNPLYRRSETTGVGTLCAAIRRRVTDFFPKTAAHIQWPISAGSGIRQRICSMRETK